MWIVMTSSASSVKGYGTYRNVALVELNQEYTARFPTLLAPKNISENAKGVLRIRHMGKHSVGKTSRSAYAVALARAEQLAQEANNAGDVASGDLLINGTCA